MHERSEWQTPGRLDLDLHLAGADADELDVVPHLEGVVADVAEQCSTQCDPPDALEPELEPVLV